MDIYNIPENVELYKWKYFSEKNIYKCKYHNLLSGQIRFKFKSNATDTNYFTTFL